jgi:hypothetical protein
VRVGAALGVAAAIAAVALAGTATSARSSTAGCGSSYRGLKTLEPKDTTLAAIAHLSRPNSTAARNMAFERRVWRLSAQITEFKLEADSGIRLVLFDAGVYGIADVPAPGCVPKNARARQAIVSVRHRFVTACGQPTNSWKPLGAVVNISGVGLWGKPHTQEPQHAPNFAELYPVTGMQIVAGCR